MNVFEKFKILKKKQIGVNSQLKEYRKSKRTSWSPDSMLSINDSMLSINDSMLSINDKLQSENEFDNIDIDIESDVMSSVICKKDTLDTRDTRDTLDTRDTVNIKQCEMELENNYSGSILLCLCKNKIYTSSISIDKLYCNKCKKEFNIGEKLLILSEIVKKLNKDICEKNTEIHRLHNYIENIKDDIYIIQDVIEKDIKKKSFSKNVLNLIINKYYQ